MNFNQIIKNRIYSTLNKLRFELLDEYDSVGFGNSIRFKSDCLIISIIFDKRERLFYISIEENNHSYPLTDSVINKLFDLNSYIDKQSDINIFADNLYSLLQNPKVQKMICGDIEKLKEISYENSHEYTNKMLLEQQVKIASKAWDDRDYRMFIEVIDKLKMIDLPKSYQLKYEIAKKKIENA